MTDDNNVTDKPYDLDSQFASEEDIKQDVKLIMEARAGRNGVFDKQKAYFDSIMDSDLEEDWDKLIECLIEGYDYEECLSICFNKRGIDLFRVFMGCREKEREFYLARQFSINKILNEQGKLAKIDGDIKSQNAYISNVKAMSKEALGRKEQAKEDDMYG